jgi:type IV secretory pathway VirB2 component (pilin)
MRRTTWLLLLVFAFAIPWEYSLDLGEPLGNIARIAGVLALLMAILGVLQAGRMRTPGALQWLVLAFYVWQCSTYFWTIDADTTLIRLRGTFQELMIVWLVWEFAEDAQDLRALLRAFVAGSWVLALLTFASFLRPEAGQVRFVAEGQDPNDVARFLDMGLPMAALLAGSESRWMGRLLAWGYLPVGLAAVLLTASREGVMAALLAMAGCGVVLLRNRPRRLIATALAAPVCAAGVWLAVPRETLERLMTIPEQVASGSFNQREDIWAAGWQAFVRSPFAGSGTGSFVSAAGLAPIDTAHNTLLSIVVQGGVVALLLFSVIVVLSGMRVWGLQGDLGIAFQTALAVWLMTLAVATVEDNRSTWLLLGVIALAARLAAEQPEDLARSFPEAMRGDALNAVEAAAG